MWEQATQWTQTSLSWQKYSDKSLKSSPSPLSGWQNFPVTNILWFQNDSNKVRGPKCSVSRSARQSSKLETPCLPFCSHLKNNVSHGREVMSLLWVDSRHNGMSDVSPAVMERPRDAFWNKLAPNWLSLHTEVCLCGSCGPIIWLLLQTFRQEKQCWKIINTLSLIWSVFKHLWVSFGRVKNGKPPQSLITCYKYPIRHRNLIKNRKSTWKSAAQCFHVTFQMPLRLRRPQRFHHFCTVYSRT